MMTHGGAAWLAARPAVWAVMRRLMVRTACGAVISLAVVTEACALPPSAIDVLEGAITFTPDPQGGGTSEISLKVRNEADVPLESIRVRMTFSRRPIKALRRLAWRCRVVCFQPPLCPGTERTVEFQEINTSLHSRIQIVSVKPCLRIALNGQRADLDPQPFLWEDTVVGPIGDIALGLGMHTSWSEEWSLATVVSRDHVLVLQIRSELGVLDAELFGLPCGIRLVDGNAIGPVAEVFRRLGARVYYDAGRNLLNVTYP